MLDSDAALAALADLRAQLPMVRHHIGMLSSPATAGQNANAGMDLANLAGTMSIQCGVCGMTDCAQLLEALHVALAAEPAARHWSTQFASATLEAFGYVQHRISELEVDPAPSVESTDRGIVVRLTDALNDARHSQVDALAMGHPGAWADGAEMQIDTLEDDDLAYNDLVPAEPAHLTDEERALLASFQSASLRVTIPAAARSTSEPARLEVPDTSPQRTDFAGSGWAPGPADVLPEEPSAASEESQVISQEVAWRIPTADELDEIPEDMKRLFLVETEEDVQDLQRALLKYQQQPDDLRVLHAMERITHKIKGTAATLGFHVLAEVIHGYEDLIRILLARRAPTEMYASSALVNGLVLLRMALDGSSAGQEANFALVNEARALVEGLSAAGGAADPQSERNPVSRATMSSFSPDAAVRGDSEHPSSRNPDGEPLLRVDIHRLDELMRHIGGLAVNRATLLQIRDDVLRSQSEMEHALVRLNDLGLQIIDLQPTPRHHADGPHYSRERQSAHRTDRSRVQTPQSHHPMIHSGAGDGLPRVVSGDNADAVWDQLELDRFTAFDTALRALSEVVADISTSSRQLRASLSRLAQVSEDQAGLAARMQRAVMHVRLVPLGSLVPRLEFEVKLLAQLAHKSVNFSVSGEMTEIDRNISEALAEPLLQLVRNAVVHGIEMAEDRAESGKPATGAVWVHAYYVGSEVIIEVGDDGRGINPHKLTASAVAAGLIDGDAARALSVAEALDLMFLPGVTTFEQARPVSGRGIGLDEVRTAIQRLKGTISARSETGKGSVFRIRVPISLSIVRALRVLAGGESYAVPFSSVQRTLSLGASELLTSTTPVGTAGSAEPIQRIRVEREQAPGVSGDTGAAQTYDEIPAVALAPLLGLEHVAHDPQMALLVEVGRQRMALLVDAVYEEQEVVVQSLPRQLQRHAVRGASVTPDGQVLLLLDLPELVAGILDGSRSLPQRNTRPLPRVSRTAAPRVLVVDDSVSIRRTLEHILQRGGFDVQLARDGIEALEMLLVDLPRVVVLDIEMPRLDGFELLSILRGSPQFAEVGVVMLTSRAADKHKELALKLGAQAYLIKPCPPETLIETVRGLLTESSSAQQ